MISVIIPVYQAEQYVEESVRSVLKQSVDNMEIILVDDGSKDRGGEICDFIAAQDNRVKVVHSENRGIIQARKRGFEHSKGDIITFVDADDWLEDNAYYELMKLWEKYNPDMLMWNYKDTVTGTSACHGYDSGYYSRDYIQSRIIGNMMWDSQKGTRAINPHVGCKFIKRELYDKVISAITDRVSLGEDALVTYPAICIAESVYIINEPYYNYRVHKDSCVRNYSLDNIKDLQMFKKNIIKSLSNYCDIDDFLYQVDCYLRIFIQPMLREWLGCDRTSQMYMLPYGAIKGFDKIKLYGAGGVGKSYKHSLDMTNYAKLVGWYDKRAQSETVSIEGVKVHSPDEIPVDDDIPILIAVRGERIAKKIRTELEAKGVKDNNIIWEEPILIG